MTENRRAIGNELDWRSGEACLHGQGHTLPSPLSATS